MKLYGAAWCNPCGVTKAKLQELGFQIVEKGSEAVFTDKSVEFIDIDKNMEDARANHVRGIPVLIDGEKRFSGFESIVAYAKSKQ